MNGGREFPSDVQDPAYEDFYGPAKPGPSRDWTSEAWASQDWQPRPDAKFLEDWLARTCELVDKYEPKLVWFDWWIHQTIFKSYLQRFAAHFYNRGVEWGVGVAINFKHDAFPKDTAVFDLERGQFKGVSPYFWQNDTAVSKNSWGYITNQDYKRASDIIGDLVDVVSKNGALLLNVGPKPDGTIPEGDAEILRAIGRWMNVNSEAIYDTRPWEIYGEGPTEVSEGQFTDTARTSFTEKDFRFTRKGNILYAIALAWPGEEALITSLHSGTQLLQSEIKQISMLGAGSLSWVQDSIGLHIKPPNQQPCDDVFVFRIQLMAE